MRKTILPSLSANDASGHLVIASWSLSLAAILLVACSRPQTQSGGSGLPVPLAKAGIDTVTPTADGGAYITTIDSGVWYVRGVEAVRVRFSQPSSQRGDFVNPDILEITPTVNGGAYAISLSNEALWYLKEGQARRVGESAGISSPVYNPSEDRFFSLYIAELKKRRSSDEGESSSAEEEEPEYDG